MTDPVLRSPSPECQHLLRVTDLHAMASRETSFLRGASHHQRFLDVHMGPSKPEPPAESQRSHVSAHVPPQASLSAGSDRMHMQPSGLQINFVLAGIEVRAQKPSSNPPAGMSSCCVDVHWRCSSL